MFCRIALLREDILKGITIGVLLFLMEETYV